MIIDISTMDNSIYKKIGNKTILIFIGVLFLFSSGMGYDQQYAFHIPFLTHSHYNPDLDESLDSDNSTDLINGSDY